MRRARNKDRKKMGEWFKELSKPKKAALIIGIILIVLLAAAVIYVASKFSKLNTEEIAEEEIFVNEEIAEMDFGDGYTNFVLFGGDSRTGEVNGSINTDAIIIVSLNNETKEVKLVSVYRDTLMDLTTGSIQKCNSAYSSGGAVRAINMLNMNLDLNIKKYVTVDFGAVADVIDMLGGIEVEISEKEMTAMNKYIKETAKAAGKKAVLIEEPGLQTLDGVQATTYARIRKGVGDDYARTERQRLVIKLVFEKVLKSNWGTINSIIDEVLPSIATNFTTSEIIMYAKNFAYYDISDSTGFPFEKDSKTVPGRGSCVYATTLQSNVVELHEFLFGTENHQVSSKVADISSRISSLVGSSSSGTTSSGSSSTSGTTSSGNSSTSGTTSSGSSSSSGTTGSGSDSSSGTTGSGNDSSSGTTGSGAGTTTTPDEGTTTTPDEGTTTTPDTGTTTTPDEGTTMTPDEGTTTTPDTGTTTQNTGADTAAQ